MWVRRVVVRGEVVVEGGGEVVVLLLSLPPWGGKMADAMVGLWVSRWMGGCRGFGGCGEVCIPYADAICDWVSGCTARVNLVVRFWGAILVCARKK